MRVGQVYQQVWVFTNQIFAAALCAETQDRQSEVLEVLDKVLSISKFPSRSILDDLVNVWNNAK